MRIPAIATLILVAGLVFACGLSPTPDQADAALQAHRAYDDCLASHPENLLSCEDLRVAWEVASKQTPPPRPGLISAGQPTDSDGKTAPASTP